ncbi:aldose epimerase family protein [Ligilactobacillus sp. LYQ60]|uniref:aldose epimerase family protein n=2 Tax=unclassified Ligilactobacillus TaxID=2767920 RepID=UPI00386209BE
MMKWGTYDGKAVERFVLTNAKKTQVAVLTLGGIVQEFSVVRDGHRENMVVNFDSVEDYVKNPYQVCKQIGRVAGRIENGQFMISGQTVSVPTNEGPNTLHGGDHGTSTQLFEGYQTADNEVTLSLRMKAATDGFPGDAVVSINYLLTDDDRLTLTYDVTAQGDTVYDPTLHIYWQLPEGLQDTDLRLNALRHMVVDSAKLPTGELEPVRGAFDFTTTRSLSAAVGNLRQEQNQQGYDDGFNVEPSMITPIAEITEHKRNLKVQVFSDRNGLVIFTADPKNGNDDAEGIYNSLATEPQTLPDALHHPEFGEIRLRAGEHKTIRMAFQIVDAE